MSNTPMAPTKACHHNTPWQDEDPRFYKVSEDGDAYFNGQLCFECIHCGVLYNCDEFTEAGTEFYKQWCLLNKK